MDVLVCNGVSSTVEAVSSISLDTSFSSNHCRRRNHTLQHWPDRTVVECLICMGLIFPIRGSLVFDLLPFIDFRFITGVFISTFLNYRQIWSHPLHHSCQSIWHLSGRYALSPSRYMSKSRVSSNLCPCMTLGRLVKLKSVIYISRPLINWSIWYTE